MYLMCSIVELVISVSALRHIEGKTAPPDPFAYENTTNATDEGRTHTFFRRHQYVGVPQGVLRRLDDHDPQIP